jgi:predicted phage terminase large subunit-like protein
MNRNVNNDLSKLRKELGRKSIKAFAKIYFKHYLDQPMCDFHVDMYKMLHDATLIRDERIAIAAPRNSAKSSISSTIYPLWSLCYEKDKFIVILSDTKGKAVEFLSHIKTEIETNEKLREDFPEIWENKPKRWANDEIVMANGSKIIALGSGQKIRGRRSRESRPSLIILDDVENETNTLTVESRDKLFNWFTKAVLKSGAQGTNVIVVGTILHYDSLLSQLTDINKMHGWRKHTYKSVISWATHQDLWQKWSAVFNYREDYMGKRGKEAAAIYFRDHQDKMLEGSQVIWPDRESYYDLMVMREQEGERSFDSEKQNSPVDLTDCPFNPDEFHCWDDEYASEEELLETLDEKVSLFAGCDPATGTSMERGDYSAIVTVARQRKTGVMYILDADIAKRTPDTLMETILTYCQMRHYSKFGIENNGFQDLIKRELERRAAQKNIHSPLEGVKNTTDKVSRILSLQPLIKSGYLRFSRKHKVLIEQLRYFPKGRYDDGPDALEMACRIAREPGYVTACIL